MRILKLNTLCGIKNQMYCDDQYIAEDRVPKVQDETIDINSLFWSKIFSPTHIKDILSITKKRLKNDLSPKVQAVIHNPEEFYNTYINALKALEMPVSEHLLFESLETLEIICYLHSKIYSDPFILTISDGFVHSAFSAQDLANICILPYYNPYLSFIESDIIPLIIEYNPNILILNGKPNIASFAIAKIIKEKLKDIFIIAAEYESDYYSLRKIENLLISNTAFFSVYNCVVLQDNKKILEQIKEALSDKSNTALLTVPSIIYSFDSGKTIHHTTGKLEHESDNLSFFDKSKGINIKAFPQNHCYWNQCNFCGINSKYGDIKNEAWDVESLIIKIKEIYSKGVKKIWFLDEAIPLNTIHDFAKQLLDNNINIKWHIRARIDPLFVDDNFVNLLHKAGMRHILFGFETASNRILQIAHKTNNTFDYLEVAEKVVHTLTNNNISVHFSSILGFPTESEQEREETCSFLKYIFNTYKGFSYNVNMFYLDIGSNMYKHWELYNITSLTYPCAPKYFLENHLDWNSSISHSKVSEIQTEQENLMRYQYPWYPNGTLLSPITFFSFWEYSRYCLLKHHVNENSNKLFMDQLVKLSPMVSFCSLYADSWLLYNLQNHHYVIGGNILRDIINESQKEIKFCEIIKKYEQPYQQQVEDLLANLTRMDFFILNN